MMSLRRDDYCWSIELTKRMSLSQQSVTSIMLSSDTINSTCSSNSVPGTPPLPLLVPIPLPSISGEQQQQQQEGEGKSAVSMSMTPKVSRKRARMDDSVPPPPRTTSSSSSSSSSYNNSSPTPTMITNAPTSSLSSTKIGRVRRAKILTSVLSNDGNIIVNDREQRPVNKRADARKRHKLRKKEKYLMMTTTATGIANEATSTNATLEAVESSSKFDSSQTTLSPSLTLPSLPSATPTPTPAPSSSSISSSTTRVSILTIDGGNDRATIVAKLGRSQNRRLLRRQSEREARATIAPPTHSQDHNDNKSSDIVLATGLNPYTYAHASDTNISRAHGQPRPIIDVRSVHATDYNTTSSINNNSDSRGDTGPSTKLLGSASIVAGQLVMSKKKKKRLRKQTTQTPSVVAVAATVATSTSTTNSFNGSVDTKGALSLTCSTDPAANGGKFLHGNYDKYYG
jgi:hypothetical protein